MKKLLFVAFCCFVPICTSFAAITKDNCTAWEKYTSIEEGVAGQKKDFDNLGPLMQEVVTKRDALNTWVNYFAEAAAEDKDINAKCKTAAEPTSDTIAQERAYKNIELSLENLLNEYNKRETQARMPFVYHGNVLPGPKEGESGADYVRTKFIPKYINAMLIFMISFSILMIIVGGLMFIYSSGDSEMKTRAKTTIFWAVLGVVITLFAYTIVKFIIGINFNL